MSSVKKGRMILLTGISGSGKSTVGSLLRDHMNRFGVRPAYLIDGDLARSFYEKDLGHDMENRDLMTRRMAFGALTLVENNIDVIFANIAPALETRRFLRSKFSDFIEVYFKADVDDVIKNDVKGIYKKHMQKDNPQLVGIDLPYEESESPEITVHPFQEKPEESLQTILDYVNHRGPSLGTKADTLASLAGYLKLGKILPQRTVSLDIFEGNPIEIHRQIKSALGSGPFIVRSSCRGEDTNETSNAGAFESIPHVGGTMADMHSAIEKVCDSYRAKHIENPEHEQVLIQPMLSDVRMSGVIFTRHQESDSPYYVINYDDSTGETDTVTGGSGGQVLFISRGAAGKAKGAWKKLMAVVEELESHFPKFPLDIEFATDKKGATYILQCRALNVNNVHQSLEQNALTLLEELKFRLRRFMEPVPHIPGKFTVLSDMADWNPAEIIGDKPATLSYSIYKEIVTDKTWHEARKSQGYFDLVNGNLMVSMARKPYIDTRLSFASLTPANIPDKVRSALVNHCLEKLRDNPHLHDKVEFDILVTCFDLTARGKIKEIKALDTPGKRQLTTALKDITDKLISGFRNDLETDYSSLASLDSQLNQVKGQYKAAPNYWDNFNAAFYIFEHLRLLGILPFARLARLAFVAHSFLNSLVEKNLMTSEDREEFLVSISTVASEFNGALEKVQKKKLKQSSFLKKFGHLRMNTYDITALRYDQLPTGTWSGSGSTPDPRKRKKIKINHGAITKALKAEGLSFNSKTLFDFIEEAIRAREDAKFRFTRVMSEGLEFIARGAADLGVSREEIQNVTLPVLFRFRNPEFASREAAAHYLKQRIGEKIHERSVFDLIKLPPVLKDTRDFEFVEFSQAKPNFTSQNKVTGKTILVSARTNPEKVNLKDKIVLIENADPGYDWIFTHNIKGLVTKFGGVASHMSIRCSEFDLPGAIGCGEIIYAGLEKSSSVLIDGKSGVVRPL